LRSIGTTDHNASVHQLFKRAYDSVKGEILSSILIDLGYFISIELYAHDMCSGLV
jgi:hypothetical protein